jgi:tartrate dehydratase beta subunit/fumarate hydratase class I family protein
VAAPALSAGFIALATTGIAGAANAAAMPAGHGPVHLANGSQAKPVAATMMLRMQNWPAAYSIPTKVDASSIFHTGPVIPPSMKWSEQDDKLAPAADTTPTQVDTSSASVFHTGPVVPPSMKWSEQDDELAPAADTTPTEVDASPASISHTGPVIPPTMDVCAQTAQKIVPAAPDPHR